MSESQRLGYRLALLLLLLSSSWVLAEAPGEPGFDRLVRSEPRTPSGGVVASVRYPHLFSADQVGAVRLGEAVSSRVWLVQALAEAGELPDRTRLVMVVPGGSYRVFEADPADLALRYVRFQGLQGPLEGMSKGQGIFQYGHSDARIRDPDPALVALVRGRARLRTRDRDREIAREIMEATDPEAAGSLLRDLGAPYLFEEALARVAQLLESRGRRAEIAPLVGQLSGSPALTWKARRQQLEVLLETGATASEIRAFLVATVGDPSHPTHLGLVDRAASEFLARDDLDAAALVLGARPVDEASRVVPSFRPPELDPRTLLVQRLLAVGRSDEAAGQVASQASLVALIRHHQCTEGDHEALDWVREYLGRPEHATLREHFRGAGNQVFEAALEPAGACSS